MKETEDSFSLTSLEEANVKSEERRAEEPIDAPVLTNNLSSDLEKERPSLAEDRKPQAAEESGMHHTHHEHQSHNEYHVHHSHHLIVLVEIKHKAVNFRQRSEIYSL